MVALRARTLWVSWDVPVSKTGTANGWYPNDNCGWI